MLPAKSFISKLQTGVPERSERPERSEHLRVLTVQIFAVVGLPRNSISGGPAPVPYMKCLLLSHLQLPVVLCKVLPKLLANP